MNIYLIAEKLSHSYSPLIHEEFNKYHYELKELEKTHLKEYIRAKNFDGLNVTIPYKIDVMQYLDEISEEALKIGSINTVRNNNGHLCGYNTDLYGFMYLLRRNDIDFSGKNILILGNGGASKTVQVACEKLNTKNYAVICRKDNNANTLSKYYNYDIIVNTTPVGMFPDTGISPVDISKFEKCTTVVDLIYNPSKTQIILDAEKCGMKAVNGLAMLVAQAKKACEIFTDNIIEDDVIEKIISRLEITTKNVVLIGMPGCGKSTIGKLLASELNRTYFDTDEEITKSGVDIQNTIITAGEEKFREIEHKISASLLNKSGYIISTGGGIVTYQPNEDIIMQNSIVFFIDRDVEKLSTAGRPLSAGGINKLRELYDSRIDKYTQLADYIIDNNGEIHNSVTQIKEILKVR